ncbi:hypothetical protein [Thermomonas fusca]|uniref:SH3 domain-containing protein n=1 Tax=Thermomonas fusca TaxID=215690 RepID=A0A5R9PH73_9GAMM|nr:hypothetical protein [Thermomonas fusca]TLX22839.1 hypothetical protein E5S66_02080 [Thermomonas fusca]
MSVAALLIALGLLAPSQNGDAAMRVQLREACAAEVGTKPKVDGVEVRLQPPPRDGDLSSLRVSHLRTGAWMTVFYDTVSADVAWARAACLGGQIGLLAEATADNRRGARWFSVAFTSDAGYLPPRDGSDTRWVVATSPDGRLPEASQRKLLVVIPHEQVHAYQKRAGAQTPRWFHEGHAEWFGRKISQEVAPQVAKEDADRSEAALGASEVPVALKRWGGVRVKREAILRQVSEQDRKRMETDPGYSPAGPFSFGPDDMESDESNTAARYQAAWALFHDLEKAHGTAAVLAWVEAVTRAGETLTSDQIVASANAALGGDMAPRLQ